MKLVRPAALSWALVVGCSSAMDDSNDGALNVFQDGGTRPDTDGKDHPVVELVEDDVPSPIDEHGGACPVLFSTYGDPGDGDTCIPRRVTSCSCPSGIAGIQTCNGFGRLDPCFCTPVARIAAEGRTAGTSVGLPSRLISPLSGLRVTTQRPTLRWALPPGLRRARVELCEDRPCARRIMQTEVEGTAWRPATALRPGVVFWRVQGLGADGAVTWTSATWEFGVRHRDTPVDSAYGTLKDFNGDGFDDIVVSVHSSVTRIALLLLIGTRGGVQPTPQPLVMEPFEYAGTYGGGHALAIGDLNGDGLADLASGSPFFQEWSSGFRLGAVRIFQGSRRCPLTSPRWIYPESSGAVGEYGVGVSIVDFNGDGYGDLAIAAATGIDLFPGSASGVGRTPTHRLEVTDASSFFAYAGALRMAGDIDGDGYGDLVVGDRQFYHGRGRLLGLYGNPEGRLDRRIQAIPGPDGGEFGDGVMAADFNGDSLADVAVGSWGTFDIYRGGPELTRHQTVRLTIPGIRPIFDGPGAVRFHAPGDLDGDGLPELFTESGGALAYKSLGAAGFPRLPTFYYAGRDMSTEPSNLMVSPGDVDADGYDDVIAGGGGYRTPSDAHMYLHRGGRFALRPPVGAWRIRDVEGPIYVE